MKIIILGINGMLGHVILRLLSGNKKWEVHGVMRNKNFYHIFKKIYKNNVHVIDIENDRVLTEFFLKIKPNLVINCTGLVKQLKVKNKLMSSIFINALFPHKLAQICKNFNKRGRGQFSMLDVEIH